MISLRAAVLARLELRTRMPFRYGIATLTDATQLIARLTFDLDGRTHTGFAADVLAPKWFTKDPARALADEVTEMAQVIRTAVTQARGVRAPTAFAFWRELYAAQSAWAAAGGIPPLLAQFGVSIVERALIDACNRASGAPLAAVLRENLLGLELGALRPELAGVAPRTGLPAMPAATLHVRHTVGLSDPLDAADLAPGERLADGLPQTLRECIRAGGLTHFKLKINGDAPRDRDRLARMAAMFAEECADGFRFSLDGNESFRDAGAFVDYARGLLALPVAEGFWSHLLFIEQPWHRDVALTPAVGVALRRWPDRPPIIIDESDAEPDSLPAALALGYAGTSHKNCKGVFKSVANACSLAQRRAAGAPGLLSGEDLTNVGPVALTQDLAAQAALGLTHVERNGHHYFAGLSQFPPALQAHALAHHGDLFERDPAGWPRLAIRGGRVALGTVNAAPFGVAGEPDLTALPCEEV